MGSKKRLRAGLDTTARELSLPVPGVVSDTLRTYVLNGELKSGSEHGGAERSPFPNIKPSCPDHGVSLYRLSYLVL